MRTILTILLLGISTWSYSQQQIDLCDLSQKTFTYSSSSNVAGSWLWLLDGDTVSTNSSVTLTWSTPGLHEILVQFDAFCPAEPKIYKVIVTECAESAIYFPNSFTPNDDGQNDIWGPKGWNIVEINWTIWNRWGEMIFESDGINNQYETTCCWDGSYKGGTHYVQNDVYVFKASWRDINGKLGQKIGHIVLIR